MKAYFPRLGDDEVHVWLAHLDERSECFERLADTLSQDEQQRTARFHSRLDARRWAAGRIVLRSLLGRYLLLEPQAVSLQMDVRAKPEVAIPPGRRPIQFNLSHSDGLGLYTVARFQRVGIDVERMRWLPDFDSIAQRMFAPHEQRALRGLPETKRAAAFFGFWTRKEAFLKATGQGLAGVEAHSSEPARWSVISLPAVSGYAASLAIEGRPVRLRFARWQERAA
jgi:4'-phosphopantetheinyl transferase